MNIGIFIANWHAHTGGGYAYQKCLLDEIIHLSTAAATHHKFIFFHDGAIELTVNIDQYCVDIGWYKGRLNEAALRNDIDIVWFLSIIYEHTDLPCIVPVWDLQHRSSPCFPEVSAAGENSARDSVYNHFLPRATYILAGTNVGKEEISFYYRIQPAKIIVNPLPQPPNMTACPVDLPDELKCYNLAPNGFFFYPAQFWPHKNHVVLLETINILKNKHNVVFKLVLTGSDHGNREYISQKITAMGLKDNVLILGFVSSESIQWLYQNAFALLYPSYFGPDNIPPLEAFSIGCPVIAADVPGSKEQLEDAAILINPSDEHGFADAILELLRTPTLREELIRKGHALVKDRTPAHYVQKTLTLIDGFQSICRCWGTQTVIKFLPCVNDWVRHYTVNKELCALVTLLETHTDNTTEQTYNLCITIILEIQNHTNIAHDFIHTGDYDSAKSILTDVVSQCSDYAPVYLLLSSLYNQLADTEKAAEYLNLAVYYKTRLSQSRLFDTNGHITAKNLRS